MMKNRVFGTIILAFSALSILSAQDLDKILDSHFKAIGQEKLLKVKTMEASGKMTITMMGAEGGIKIFNKRPNKMRVEVEVMGSAVVQAYDGTTVWTINPMTGSGGATVMTGPEADGLIETADMDGQLWDYKKKGHALELLGKEELDGAEAYVLKLTKKNGNVDHYFIDSKDYVIVKTKSTAMMNGMEMEVETLLSDYREEDGYLGAYSIEQKYNGQTSSSILLDEIKYDVLFEDAIFTKPSGEEEIRIF